MVNARIKILGIAPYEGMRTVMERAAQAYPEIQLDIHTGDLEEGVAIVESMAPNSYDCIISRGGTAEMIRQVTDLPVVEIQLSVYDVLSAMKLAENYSRRYAIVGFASITETAHTLCDLLGSRLDILTVRSAEEVPEVLGRLKEEGYRMVVCDMVTHTAARRMGLDAFLITSGVESLHSAIDQAISISLWFGRLRQENMFLRSITQDENGRVVVMEGGGSVFYSSHAEPSQELSRILRRKLKEVPPAGSLKFYHTEQNQLYRITGQTLLMDGERYVLYYCVPSRIPLHSNWGKGVRSMNRGECEYLFTTSFYSVSGAMGILDRKVRTMAAARQPVMICGEEGTGKEQIARFLYLNSPLSHKPFVTVNCELMNEKSWDFLFNNDNSPLNGAGNTVYFQNLEAVTEERGMELLALIQETGLARRVRLIFSSACGEAAQELVRRFTARLGCLLLNLPSLRSRSDEIPSLASLYLSSLKLELGKQISGFEPRAIEMLREYDWPGNYTQFKHVLQTLATMTESTYIRGSAVAELLAGMRSGRKRLPQGRSTGPGTVGMAGMTLEEIIREAVEQAVAANGGNRAQAARQLGISRTTLWRYMNKEGAGPGAE